MSDTPRTDALLRDYLIGPLAVGVSPAWVEFTRQLEREIAALKHDLERAQANHAADLKP